MEPIYLSSWQRSFVDKYVAGYPRKAQLAAAAGSGKTVATLIAAKELFHANKCDLVLTIADRIVLKEQWRQMAETHAGINAQQGRAITLQSLDNLAQREELVSISTKKRTLIVVDEVHRSQDSDTSLRPLLEANRDNRILFLTRLGENFGDELKFNYTFEADEAQDHRGNAPPLSLPGSPSFELLKRLISEGKTLEDLSWRAFEILVAELLKADGYEVELMQGTKDGGVDVIATRNMGPAGVVKTLWQAKKYSKGKVGLSVIRELADTRAEHGANKALVITSTFLTRGALQRIEREKFLLGKVDRNDLRQWLVRYANGTWSPDSFI